MNIKKLTFKSAGFPEVLRHIDSPPQALYQLGAPLIQLLERPAVTIVGSRSASVYGQRVTEELAGLLAERGIVVVSGLALGIDCIAHQAALEAGGLAIAVLAVPGNITNIGSTGTNNLLKSGVTPLTSYLNVLYALGLQDAQQPKRQPQGRTAYEQTVIDLLLKGVSDGNELLERSSLSASHFNQALAMLEIGGKIRPLGANHWALY